MTFFDDNLKNDLMICFLVFWIMILSDPKVWRRVHAAYRGYLVALWLYLVVLLLRRLPLE